MEGRISREEIIRIYNIEFTFFDELEACGLIQTEVIDEVIYLNYEQLPNFERFTNWYYDLEVNMPGLEIINRLLNQIQSLQQENRKLLNR
ncbi:chaperone modulator CbpM [Capnocytophaga cynodegmi]|uniref:chaperone modulator CbpM n=1 Tax=Capnocytophaga cynodegmi TaxID=28189 RepID=UPI00385EA238